VVIVGLSNENVVSVDDGIVLFVSNNFRSYGKLIIVEHKDNIHTIYGMLGDILVNEGSKVKKGQVIAKTDSSGQIYFELRKNFIPVDPELYFE
jgi:septal ring factor EnvC (AmiA/AmiB activator)